MIAYGLLGASLAHSHSKRIHGLLGDYVYEHYPVDEAQLADLLTRRAFLGLNVTIPYKLTVMPYCDRLSPEAEAIGSVNTLVFDSAGQLWGHNTDLFGFEAMAHRAGIDMIGKKVLILGSGGASRTAQAAARRQGARAVVVVSRRGPVDYDCARAQHADADIIVNTTPVGMYPKVGDSPVALADFPHCAGVLDMVYNPLRTALLEQAAARGIAHANGLWMLIAQAWRAAELFTGAAIPAARARRAEGAVLRALVQPVLIGMPGSGKTTLGQGLAQRLGRRFVDIDEWIEQRAGHSPKAIIQEQGEAVFRALEREAIQTLGKESGLVLATGGGAVLDPRNIQTLRQNGRLLWIQRDLERLATQGRPLSQSGAGLAVLAERRLPLYQAACDGAVDNNGALADSLNALEEAFYEGLDPQWAESEPAGSA